MAGSCHIRPDPDRFGKIQSKSSGSDPINGRIQSYPAVLARSSLISGQIRPNPCRFGQIQQEPVGFRQYSRRNLVA
jgi:hypothetical protein